MNSTEHETRRSFLRKFAAGTLLAAAGISAKPREAEADSLTEPPGDGETVYRETGEFRDYYRSLRG